MSATQMPGLSGLLEAAIYVDDLDATERFYGELLGLPVVLKKDGAHVFFRCGSTIILAFVPEITRAQTITPDQPVPPHGATGAGHICLAVPEGALDEWRARLEKAGIELESDFHWPSGPRSIYVRDPAGNSVEFSTYSLWDISE